MQASSYGTGHDYGCDKKGEAPRSIGAAMGLAMWPAVHTDTRGRRGAAAETAPSNAPALVPIRGTSASRRATHCSGVTGVDGRLLRQGASDAHTHTPTQWPNLRGIGTHGARRRAPTDGEGAETARFGRTSDVAAARQPRRGVKFTGDDADGDDDGSTASDDGLSETSSADEYDSGRGGRGGRRSQALELPALPGNASASASAGAAGAGGGGGSAASAGPAGVTLAFLESLRAASRPGTTLRDLYWSLVLPATRAARCAYVGLLGAEHRARPMHVVVCSWDERISDMVDCLADHHAATTAQQHQQHQHQHQHQQPSAAAAASSCGPGAAVLHSSPPHFQSADVPSAVAQAHRSLPGLGGGGGRVLAAAHASDSGGGGGRLALRRSIEALSADHSGGASAAAVQTAAWLSGTAAAAAPWAQATAGTASHNHSPCLSPVLSQGQGVSVSGGGGPQQQQPLAVWLDLFAVNFHSPAAAPAAAAAAAAGFGAAARLGLAPSASATSITATVAVAGSRPYIPSLDTAAAALERSRALPAAIASVRSVLLLPGPQGAGLREHPVTLAAWHALRGRGCAGGAALALAAPPDVDVALLQAAFEGLALSSATARAPDESAAAAAAGLVGGAAGFGADSPAAAGGSSSTSACPSPLYESPDRLAVRAAREGAIGGASAAAAAAAIYAADPLPSRTVREGLVAAATSAANALLTRPVGLSAARPMALLQTTMSLPPAAAPPAAPLLQPPPSAPTPLSPTLQSHTVLQGRSFSVNALEAHSYTPSYTHSTSRLSLLSSPLRSGPAAPGCGPSARSLLLAGTEAWQSSSTSAAAAAAAAASLARSPSGRSVSFTSLPLGAKAEGPDGDDEDEDDEDGVGGGGGGTGSRARHLAAAAAGGGGSGGRGRDRRGRHGSTAVGTGVAGEAVRGGGGSGLASPLAAVTSSYDGGGGGEAQPSVRRLPSLIPPPLDVTMTLSSALSPASLPPALSPSGWEAPTGGGSGRLLQLRSGAVAPWEASAPLPTLLPPPLGRSPGGASAPPCGDSGDDAAVAPKAPALSSPSSSASPGPAIEPPPAAPHSLPLPRLAPLLQAAGATAAPPPPPPLPPPAAASAATSSAPLPLPFRDVITAAAAEAAAGPLLATPFGRIRKGSGPGLGPGTRQRGSGPAAPRGGGRGMGREEGGSTGVATPGADPDLEQDPDPDLGAFEAEPQNSDSDLDSDGPPIVLDSLSCFLTGQATLDALESCTNRQQQQQQQQQQRPAAAPLQLSLNGSSGGAAAASTSTAAPPVPESLPQYDIPPYRPLAPDLARLVGTGRLLAALGQPMAALRLVRHALTSARSFHGSNHPDTARCAAALGGLALHCQQQQHQQQQLQLRSSGSEADFGCGGGRAAAPAAGSRVRSQSVAVPPGDRCGPAGPAAFPARPAGLMAAAATATATAAGRGEAAAAAAAVGGGGGGPGLPGAASAPISGILSGTIGPPSLRLAASPSRTRRGPGGGGGGGSSGGAAPSSPMLSGSGSGSGSWSVEEAEGLLRGAAAVLERFLGPDNEETLAARQGLAAVLAAEGRYDEAVPVLQRAATGRASRRRPASEVAVGSAADLAACLAALGRAKEARKLLRAQLVRLQEDEDEAAATAAAAAMTAAAARGGRSSLLAGSGNGASGGAAAALPSAASVTTFLAGRPSYGVDGGGTRGVGGIGSVAGSGCGSPCGSVLGGSPQQQQQPAHQPLAGSRGLTALKREELRARCSHRLAQLKAASGKAQAARILYRRAVQSYAAVYGNSHAVTAGCMLSLAALSHTVREYGEALELYRAVLDLYVEMYGPHHPATTRVSNRLGDLEEEMEEAEMEQEQ
ncbi:hypothetical protein PLESTB_001058500 [Pleodorina starrii]|uniref:Uncharacterized protein n=1 Tax=Pleodorina starrii TaxID=330485 RepID=A0A9W6BPS7_9CHLO|nr:hypothetical protein PLESTB_001058500 [Pleodorina starrii]